MSSQTPKILLCSGSLEGGGSERQLWQLACGLEPSQLEPQVYLLNRKGIYLDRLPKRIPVHDYWSEEKRTKFLPTEIHRRQVRHLENVIRRERIDILYDRTFHMTLVTAPACRRAGIPRISVIVSPPSRDFARSSENFAFLKRRALKRAYADPSALTLAVTEEVASDAENYLHIPSGKIAVVPNPVDLEAVRAAASKPCSDLPASDVFSCVVVGRMTKEKGQRLAIEAFANLVRNSPSLVARLELLGDGPDRPALEKLVAEFGLVEHVRFHGFVDNPYPWISRADALILPSEYEGLPNVVLEAMTLKTVVVATQCSNSLSRILTGASHEFGKTGVLLETRDAEELAESLRELSNAAPQEGLDRAFRYVQSEHDLPGWLKRMQHVFEAQLAERRG